ncbi:hypothetical protein [Chryseobacterium chendengshani]|uniref:hypothetical protein n=1 Tax=Chryseobacterium sp. LJ756 TaxID=2864113 RepID=UPI001C641231|nr:hypothetical protein [Chryseobacterium sp. LJ756]MBW7673958.1 hypothetical protein [Chryseobacterium sp. LJ756]
MKKLLLLIAFVSFQILFSQNILDLDLKNVELQGMKPVKVNQEMKDVGITQNPFITNNPDIISKIANEGQASKIKNLYAFVYNNPKDDLHDGGVYIYEFKTKSDLQNYFKQNFEQSNYRVLVKDLFYIRIWSDYSLQLKGKETSDDHLNKMEKYYTKLGAKRIILKPDESIITVVQ